MTDIQRAERLILIVDDSPDTLSMLNDVLESANMTTLVALEGKQALSIAKKMTPDVILMDAIMPNMDGFETCAQLKASPELRNIPVIFMTGLSDTDSIVKGFAAGGVDYLTKPINPQELIVRIITHLNNARTALSAQTALDTAGQNIFAIDDAGNKLWATPMVSHLLAEVSRHGATQAFEQALQTWLMHTPDEGNRLPISVGDSQYTAIYFGSANQGEHLIRLVDESAGDAATILKQQFAITAREADTFLWLAKGKTNREIAQILDMRPRTVNKHLEQLFKKLQVDNRTTAAAMAIQCLQKKRGG